MTDNGSATDTQSVATVEFPSLEDNGTKEAANDISLLGDVGLDVTVELGRVRMRVRDVLALQAGSVVDLDRAAGAAVDIVVNGTLVARGDVVVVDDELGVRITEVVERQ